MAGLDPATQQARVCAPHIKPHAESRRSKRLHAHSVNQFPGTIGCSSLSKSEIVVPLVVGGETKLVLDIDSDKVGDFNAVDQRWLERSVSLNATRHY